MALDPMYGGSTAFIDADSNGGTDIALVAAKTAHHIVLDYILITASAAASAFIESDGSVSDTVIFPTVYLAAGDNVQIDNPCVRSLVGEALVFNATVTGNISCFVRYHYEPGAGAYA